MTTHTGKAVRAMIDEQGGPGDDDVDDPLDNREAGILCAAPDLRAFVELLNRLDNKFTRAALGERGVSLTADEVTALIHLQIHKVVSECRNHYLRKLTELAVPTKSHARRLPSTPGEIIDFGTMKAETGRGAARTSTSSSMTRSASASEAFRRARQNLKKRA